MQKCYLLIVTLYLFPTLAFAQTSIGFQNPGDVQNLLDYRLPDWSYRTFDARLALNGQENSDRQFGLPSSRSQFHGNLLLDYQRSFESDERILQYGGAWITNYTHSRDSHRENETTNSQYRNSVDLNGSFERFLGGGPVSVMAAGAFRHRYSQDHLVRTAQGDSVDSREYSRARTLTSRVGMGLGRLRNVRPLLQAQRLSERLQALGRPALSSQQVRRVAEIIATEYGYGHVYDRPDKFFWQDVFEPLVEAEKDLSPYEILFLQEALNEDLGTRFEGLRLGVEALWSELLDGSSDGNRFHHSRRIRGEISYFHNPELRRQYRAQVSLNYRWSDSGQLSNQAGYWEASVGHLWNLTDRLLWDLGLGHDESRSFDPEHEYSLNHLTSDFRFRVEDRMSLSCGLDLRYHHGARDEDVVFGWELVYNLGLSYDLGAGLVN